MLPSNDSFAETEARLNKGAIWAIVYGDFMSYLMIFFLILFAFSLEAKVLPEENRDIEASLVSIQKTFGGEISQERLARLTRKQRERNVAKELRIIIKDEQLKHMISIETTKEKVKIILNAPVLFGSGQAKLRQKAGRLIYSLGKVLKPLDNQILVEGHTDNIPIGRHNKWFNSNWGLSSARAYAVVKLFNSMGIPGKRLVAIGYGEFRPIASNRSAVGRAKNRRIEICLLRTQ